MGKYFKHSMLVSVRGTTKREIEKAEWKKAARSDVDFSKESQARQEMLELFMNRKKRLRK